MAINHTTTNSPELTDGQFFDEVMSVEHRRASTKRRKLTPSKGGYKWRHGGVHRMRFTEPTYDGQPLPERMILFPQGHCQPS
jgi:hypothetical protein